MTGQEYEERCARRLRRCGFDRVTLTGGSGDQGVDILARHKGERYAIQCKYYSRPVGNHAVQEAFAGARYYGCDHGVVLTNSTFTPAAVELADSTGVLLWPENALPYPPCRSLIIRWMGILIALAAAVALAGFYWFGPRSSPLQIGCLCALMAGGLLSALEFGLFGMDLAACGCWVTAACLALADPPLQYGLTDQAGLWLLLPLAVSALRALRLVLRYLTDVGAEPDPDELPPESASEPPEE